MIKLMSCIFITIIINPYAPWVSTNMSVKLQGILVQLMTFCMIIYVLCECMCMHANQLCYLNHPHKESLDSCRLTNLFPTSLRSNSSVSSLWT